MQYYGTLSAVLTTFAEYKISAMNSCNKIFSNQSDTRKGLPYQVQVCRFSYSYFLKKNFL